jgi:hypothetical protein
MPSFTPPYTGKRTTLIWDLDQPWVLGGPIFQLPGTMESIAYTVTVKGSNAPASPAVDKVYRNGTDVESTVMPSGSSSASGQVITMPAMTALTPGSDYVIILQATINSQTYAVKIPVQCLEAKSFL